MVFLMTGSREAGADLFGDTSENLRSGMVLCQRVKLGSRKRFFTGGWSGPGMDSVGLESWYQIARDQEAFELCSQTQGLNFRLDSYRSLPTPFIL